MRRFLIEGLPSEVHFLAPRKRRFQFTKTESGTRSSAPKITALTGRVLLIQCSRDLRRSVSISGDVELYLVHATISCLKGCGLKCINF